jgi:hypothetical protein
MKGDFPMLSKEYIILFNAITDAINILTAAQQQAEEEFISQQAIQTNEKGDVEQMGTDTYKEIRTLGAGASQNAKKR